jgi:hypothetical protein
MTTETAVPSAPSTPRTASPACPTIRSAVAWLFAFETKATIAETACPTAVDERRQHGARELRRAADRVEGCALVVRVTDELADLRADVADHVAERTEDGACRRLLRS